MPSGIITCLTIGLMGVVSPRVLAAPPDLTQPGVIATINRSETYNLGPTGMRGWIYLSRGGSHGQDGTMTGESRQILVTVASSPASDAGVQVNDVILGAGWGTGKRAVPHFTSDARKAFGNAITQAEKKDNRGILRLRIWRAGLESDVNVTLRTMGTYAATAPYQCPKSKAVLDAVRSKMVGDLLSQPGFLDVNYYNGAIAALSLLSGVTPDDPDYDAVQTRLQTYARTMAANGPQNIGNSIWTWSYSLLFLSEYYLSTGDATVLPGIQTFTLKMAQSQSIFGTYGHNPAHLRSDGSGRMNVGGYGPVNSAGLPANLSLVMGKKALVAGSQPIDPLIDTAIQRGANFFAWYVNKGSIPYGENAPFAVDHATNGKDQSAAVFFSQLDNRKKETEYFTRMSVAGFPGREYGHSGQGLSYLWEGLATHVGGAKALSAYLKPVLWHLDLSRRTDGSFAYDGGEQYGAGRTADGTYLGATDYRGLSPTPIYLLTYSLPLKRLIITGKNDSLALHKLSTSKVADAVAAATYKFDRASRSTTELMKDLIAFDPVVRNLAAQELATRKLTPTQLGKLRTMISDSNPDARISACQTLSLLKDAAALPMIARRLDKTIEPETWVRAQAAYALRNYGTEADSQVPAMLAAFAANATDPDTILWDDPIQAGNSALAWALFANAPGSRGFTFTSATAAAPKNLLRPAVSAGLKQPDSASRSSVAGFSFGQLNIDDIKALPNDLITLIRSETQCGRMWNRDCRLLGIKSIGKHKFFETMPMALELLQIGDPMPADQAMAEIAGFGESARWTLPTLRAHLLKKSPESSTHTALVRAIHAIEAATTSPAAPAITYLMARAEGQVTTTAKDTAKSITLTGSSCREPSLTFTVLTQPSHGILSGTAPDLTYTPNPGYTGPDQFTFHAADTLTTSAPATVGIVVGNAGTGLKGEYFDNADFSEPLLTLTDPQVNFDWGSGSPAEPLHPDSFSVLWSGQLLVPETCPYTFSTLSNDGVRLYIDGTCVIDNFVEQNTKWVDSAPIPLTKGQMVEIQMEYFENAGSAAAKLKWTGPSIAGTTGAIIPQAYLHDGSTIPQRTPYAHAQTVTALQNTAKAIKLTGSGMPQSYTVLSKPANGTLSGTPPSLTYTPDNDFTGTDSFTFQVNHDKVVSSPATVSISVLSALPTTYSWAKAVAGKGSDPSKWVGSISPPVAGAPNTILHFPPTGTYEVTHDLSDGFQLNQLHFASAATLGGTNSLSLVANGGSLPQINQNSTNPVTVSTPLILSAPTTFGGDYGGMVTLNGPISGSGTLVKTNPGVLKFNNVHSTYTGGTILNNGIVAFAAGSGGMTPFFGTGSITINANATFVCNRTYLSNAITLNGCKITGGNGWGSVFSGPVTLSGITTIDMGNTGGFGISGNINGTGGLKTIGSTECSLNGTNTYTGPTTIQAGAIRYQNASSVAPGPLAIATGAKANLKFTGNAVVASLTLGDMEMPPGTYGSSASPATFKNDGFFTAGSLGTITVGPADYTSR